MNKTILIISLALLIFIAGCNVESKMNSNPNFKDVTSNQAYELIQYEDVLILDVRTDEEFALGHIEGSINIDFYNPNFKNMLNELEKDKSYIIYCRSGRRSGITLDIMEELEFTKAYNVLGGINSWQENKLPLVKN